MRTHIIQFIFLILIFSIFLPGVDDEERVQKYLRDLDGAGDWEIALECLAAMKEPRAIPYLAEILNKESSRVIGSAIRHLGRIGHPDGIIPLVEYLLTSDDRYYYDDECLDSLRQIDCEWMTREEVQAYIPRFFEEFKKAREGDTRDDNGCTNWNRQNNLLKFIYLTAPGQAVPLSLEFIANPGSFNHYNTEMILKNLVDNNVREAWDPILKQLLNPGANIFLFQDFVEALDKLQPGWKETEAFETNLNALLKKMEGKQTEYQRYHTVKLLKTIKPSALIPLLEKVISDPSAAGKMKAKAISELGEISPGDHFDLFVSGLKSTDEFVRFACVESLGKTDNVEAVTYLAEVLGGPEEDIKMTTISALEALNTVESIRPLVDLTNDPENSNLVVFVFQAISSIEPGPPVDEMIRIWEKWKQRIPYYRRESMLYSFFRVSDPRAMDYLIRIYPTVSESEKLQLVRFFIKKKDLRLLSIFREALKSSDIRMRAYAEAGIFKLDSNEGDTNDHDEERW